MVFQLMFFKVGINIMSAELLEHCLYCRPHQSLIFSQFNKENRAVAKEEEKRKRRKFLYLLYSYAGEIYPSKKVTKRR